MAFMKMRTPGAFSAGASVSSRICSASSIRPRPIETRPMSLMRERAPLRNATSPRMKRTGATAGDIERQNLNNQRGPDIRPEHDRKRRNKADQAFRREGTGDQRRRGAALQKRRQTKARRKRGEAISQRSGKKPAEIGAERAQDSAVDHVQAPQQQRNATHQVEKNHGSHDHALRNWDRMGQAISKLPRINPISGRHCPADAARLYAPVHREPIVEMPGSDCAAPGMSIST